VYRKTPCAQRFCPDEHPRPAVRLIALPSQQWTATCVPPHSQQTAQVHETCTPETVCRSTITHFLDQWLRAAWSGTLRSRMSYKRRQSQPTGSKWQFNNVRHVTRPPRTGTERHNLPSLKSYPVSVELKWVLISITRVWKEAVVSLSQIGNLWHRHGRISHSPTVIGYHMLAVNQKAAHRFFA
jgi:hypothetical protein